MSGLVRVSEAASIAIHAMVLLATQPERIWPVKDLAATLGLSGAHLAKVMQRLAKAGLVVSSRGPSGGFRLARPAGEISLLVIHQSIEGPPRPAACLLPPEVCPGGSCCLGDVVARANADVTAALAQQDLAQLAASFLARHPGAVHPA